MAENEIAPEANADGGPFTDAGRTMRNVLVLAVADGEVADAEKAYIESLRQKLGVDADEFHRLCREVRGGERSIVLPSDPAEAEATMAALAGLAAADEKISPVELRALQRIARRLGIDSARLDAMIDQAGGSDEMDDLAAAEMTEELYRHFAEWDAAARRAKIEAFTDMGRAAVKPLVRILESYRKPEDMPDANRLKTLVVEQLGRLGDSRPVYYLAQQVSIGDSDDEITCLDLRAAAAEAIGKITGEGFARDADGIAGARQWWQEAGRARYDHLMY